MDNEEFRQWRSELGFTQAKAAETLHVSERMVQHYEAGSKPVTSRTAARCADVRLRRSFYLRGGNYDPKRDEVETPAEFFFRLHREFDFDIDVAASPINSKLERFFSREDNSLSQPWIGTVWCNPPFEPKMLGEWLRKAYESAQAGATVVLLCPARTNAEWWRDYALRASEIRFVTGWLWGRFARVVVLVFRPGQHSPKVTAIPARLSLRIG